MKKTFLLLATALIASSVFSQSNELSTGAASSNTGSTPKGQLKQQEALNNRTKTDDKLDQLDITGLGGSTFSSMNPPEFTSRGTNSITKITQALLVGPNKAPGYQLVFTSDNNTSPYAVETKDGVTSVFFPMSIYEFIQQKLETAVAQKKKVQLKITQNPNGFREGLLVF